MIAVCGVSIYMRVKRIDVRGICNQRYKRISCTYPLTCTRGTALFATLIDFSTLNINLWYSIGSYQGIALTGQHNYVVVQSSLLLIKPPRSKERAVCSSHSSVDQRTGSSITSPSCCCSAIPGLVWCLKEKRIRTWVYQFPSSKTLQQYIRNIQNIGWSKDTLRMYSGYLHGTAVQVWELLVDCVRI